MRVRVHPSFFLLPLLFLCGTIAAETAGPPVSGRVRLIRAGDDGKTEVRTLDVDAEKPLEFRHDSAIKSWTGIPLDPAQLAGRELLFSIGVEAEDLPESVKNGDGILVQIHYVAANGKEQFLRLPIPNKNGAMSRHTLKIAFPEGIRKAGLDLALLNVAGTVRFHAPEFREERPAETFQTCTVTGTLDRENALYEAGEPMIFRFRILAGIRTRPAHSGGRRRQNRSADTRRRCGKAARIPQFAQLSRLRDGSCHVAGG